MSEPQTATQSPRICAAPGCGHVLVRRSRELPREWEQRRFCSVVCSNHSRKAGCETLVKASEKRNCPHCGRVLVPHATETPTAFRKRIGCGGPSCNAAIKRQRALAYHSRRRKSVSSARPPVQASGAKLGEYREDEIARFLAERGITRCPTAAAAPTSAQLSTADREGVREYEDRREIDAQQRAARHHRWGYLG